MKECNEKVFSELVMKYHKDTKKELTCGSYRFVN